MSKANRKQLGKLKTDVVLPQADSLLKLPVGYGEFRDKIKNKVLSQRIKFQLNANYEMIMLYWQIGTAILEKQNSDGWGSKVIDRLAYDLKSEFPDMKGFSPRNLKYMRAFASAWRDIEIVQRTVAQIPWRSNITLLDKIKDPVLRLWYAQKVIENGYGKDMLVMQIESNLYHREGAAISNFVNTTPPPLNSDLIQQSFKDPYIFDFIGTELPKREAELEQKLIDHIQKFLLELGQGFAFVGRQVLLELGDKDYYIDLLFYHLKLRCYVVVELKAGEFKPEFISKLNLYQNVVNDVLKQENDNQTIGLLLVKEKNKLVVEYSLMNNSNPVGVANWEHAIAESFPIYLKSDLPSIEEIENELSKDLLLE